MAPTRYIAVMNQKGGVGKTTLTVNLGAALGRMGKEVLILDLDPQANLSIHLDINIYELPCSIYDVMVGSQPFSSAVIRGVGPGLSLVPANIDLSGAEVELVNAVGRETLLRDALRPYVEEQHFDFVIFDCPPSLGILSLNALAAADEVFIPIQTEFFALQGLAKLVGVIELIEKRLNPGLRIGRVIPTLYDSRTALSKEVLADIKKHFGDKVTTTLIRKNVRLAEAPSYGKSIFDYAATAPGSRDFMSLAQEILNEPIEGPKGEPKAASATARTPPVKASTKPAPVPPVAAPVPPVPPAAPVTPATPAKPPERIAVERRPARPVARRRNHNGRARVDGKGSSLRRRARLLFMRRRRPSLAR